MTSGIVCTNTTPFDGEIFHRSRLVLGADGFDTLRHARVIIFGVGGVGSWCAESLVRTGVHHLTIVDKDVVCTSNINRQLMATTRTVGMPKVEALRLRLMEINPQAEICALQQVFCSDTAEDFHLDGYDVIIDAIDSLPDKAHLILLATEICRQNGRTHFFSSMGAALRSDPTRIRTSEFWKIEGDALARALRNRYKKNKTYPAGKFQCVWSDESPLKREETLGSLSFVTGIFGFTLAGLAVRSITQRTAMHQ